MAAPAKLPVYDDDGAFDPACTSTLISGLELLVPIPDNFLSQYVTFLETFPQFMELEASLLPLPAEMRDNTFHVLRVLLDPRLRFTAHRDCALELFAQGQYAFPLDARSKVFCLDCVLSTPQLVSIFAEVTSALANSGTPLEHLVVIPNHTTSAADAQFQALQDASAMFLGPAYAWGGDAERKAPADLFGTPSPQMKPMRRAPPSEADTEDSQQQEGHCGMSPVRDLHSAALMNSALMLPPQELAHPPYGIPAVDAGSHHNMLGVSTAEALVPAQPAAQPAKYVAPALRNPTTRALLPSLLNAPSRSVNPLPVNPQTVTASHLPQPQPPVALAPPSSQLLPPLPVSLRVLSPQHLEPGEAAGIPSFAALMDATVPSMGFEELMSGSVDGLTVDDLASPSALRREMRENYSGDGVSKAVKSVMRRVMQVDTLGESTEFLHTPLHLAQDLVTTEGNKLKVKDRLKFPKRDRFLTYCRKRVAEWNTILLSGCGVFSPSYGAHLVHQRTALIIKARYEFLNELVEYAALEWSWCSWEGIYVFLTAKYVAVWEMSPFSKAVKLDRDLLRFHSEELVGDRREAVRQYISDTVLPTQLTDILAKVNMVTGPPTPAAPRVP
eukprot:gene9340-11068_t